MFAVWLSDELGWLLSEPNSLLGDDYKLTGYLISVLL